jgi:hypothetical protein
VERGSIVGNDIGNKVKVNSVNCNWSYRVADVDFDESTDFVGGWILFAVGSLSEGLLMKVDI